MPSCVSTWNATHTPIPARWRCGSGAGRDGVGRTWTGSVHNRDRATQPHQLWDALIVQAAKRAGCDEILTEDLTDGQTIEGIRIRNPFGGT
jgi:hypothetical protein